MTVRLLSILAVAVLSFAVMSCDDDDSGAPSEPTDATPSSTEEQGTVGTIIGVNESEYTIRLNQRTAPAGEMKFILMNEGSIAHQFVLVKTEIPAEDLPLAENGFADTQAEGIELIYKEEAFPPAERRELELTLDPGHYVMLCNLPGHYARGMRVNFVAGAERSSQTSP